MASAAGMLSQQLLWVVAAGAAVACTGCARAALCLPFGLAADDDGGCNIRQ
jgi:hypothetical protein